MWSDMRPLATLASPSQARIAYFPLRVQHFNVRLFKLARGGYVSGWVISPVPPQQTSKTGGVRKPRVFARFPWFYPTLRMGDQRIVRTVRLIGRCIGLTDIASFVAIS